MNIAVIGWGSLIWDQRDLKLSTRWHRNGPELPVEFARKSSDGRLTLVIQAGVAMQRTYWARSAYPDLAEARHALRRREGTLERNIVCVAPGASPSQVAGAHSVRDWLSAIGSLDAAVFTGLPPSNGVDTLAGGVDYLRILDTTTETFRVAKEYVTKAPEQINTPVRKVMRERFAWVDVPLPPELFEP